MEHTTSHSLRHRSPCTRHPFKRVQNIDNIKIEVWDKNRFRPVVCSRTVGGGDGGAEEERLREQELSMSGRWKHEEESV